MPHILLIWTMTVATMTGTEHGDWRYLGTYENQQACQQAFLKLSNPEYNIYGKFVCQPQGSKETQPTRTVRF